MAITAKGGGNSGEHWGSPDAWDGIDGADRGRTRVP
jgi:hypothetical protein